MPKNTVLLFGCVASAVICIIHLSSIIVYFDSCTGLHIGDDDCDEESPGTRNEYSNFDSDHIVHDR